MQYLFSLWKLTQSRILSVPFLRSDNDWVEPVVCVRGLFNLLQDASLHLFFDLCPQGSHVSFCNLSVGAGSMLGQHLLEV